MNKEKKPLTEKEKLKRVKTLKNVCRFGEIAVLPIPFSVLAIVNRAEWFPTPEIGFQVGAGAAISIVLMSIIGLVLTSHKEKKITDGYGILLIAMALIIGIAMLTRYIADQIVKIGTYSLTGIAAGFGLDLAKKKLAKKEEEQSNIVKTAEMNRAVEKASKELEEENKKEKKNEVRF